jgi:hypothetical protein
VPRIGEARPNIHVFRANTFHDPVRANITPIPADVNETFTIKYSVPTDSRLHCVAPALWLMISAPLVAELLPGATRLSAIFVLPIEILVWGGAALIIREIVRRRNLGWPNMLLLALALVIAEECLIQQTSLAPLVIKLKGVEYARAGGINYVYFLWAALYESLFVVFVPIGFAELVFYRRRHEAWMSNTALVIVSALFLVGALFAWFTWTQIARPHIFHVERYTPSATPLAAAAIVIISLVVLAVGPTRRAVLWNPNPLPPPHPILIGLSSGGITIAIFALELLAFGILPSLPPWAAVALASSIVAVLVLVAPRCWAHPRWSSSHQCAAIYGAILANMAIFFVAFIGSTPTDFYGKIILDLLATVLLIWLAPRLIHSSPTYG